MELQHSALAGTAAGELWDNFDGTTLGLGVATIPDAIKSHGGGNNVSITLLQQ